MTFIPNITDEMLISHIDKHYCLKQHEKIVNGFRRRDKDVGITYMSYSILTNYGTSIIYKFNITNNKQTKIEIEHEGVQQLNIEYICGLIRHYYENMPPTKQRYRDI